MTINNKSERNYRGKCLGWPVTSYGAVKWFRSYIEDRKQFDGIKSKVKELRYGVPQGSVLGLILYLLYKLPIRDIIRRHGLNYHLYADDTQLYLSFKSIPAEQAGSIAKIEACVSEIDS